jgi:ribosome-associated translation inhibitor RaiA
MIIQINTDKNIKRHQVLAAYVRGIIDSALNRISDHITRIEVHLSDENGKKSGQNVKRCIIEARLEGRRPSAVSHEAATLHQAINGAVKKLTRMLESILGRLNEKKRRTNSAWPGQ